MSVDDRDAEGLVPKFDHTTAEGTAKAVLWALDGLVGWFAPHPRQGNHVFQNDEDLLTVWLAHGGSPEERPRVDFSRFTVVAVFVDEGTYRECPKVVSAARRNGELVVTVGRLQATYEMINPASVVTIPRFDGSVRFAAEAG